MNECDHEELCFGSGAFYIFCSHCPAVWVAKQPGGDDTDLDYDRGGDNMSEIDIRVWPGKA